MTFIEADLFHDKRTNLTVYESTRSILLARNRDDIHWSELFHAKRTSMNVYEKLSVDFIGRESWWHLLKWISCMIREWT
jgi:hypothetical protein